MFFFIGQKDVDLTQLDRSILPESGKHEFTVYHRIVYESMADDYIYA